MDMWCSTSNSKFGGSTFLFKFLLTTLKPSDCRCSVSIGKPPNVTWDHSNMIFLKDRPMRSLLSLEVAYYMQTLQKWRFGDRHETSKIGVTSYLNENELYLWNLVWSVFRFYIIVRKRCHKYVYFLYKRH